MKPPIAVTGANGFVGSHVVEALLAGGYAVRCLLRTHSQPLWIETLPADIRRVDFSDPNALAKALDGCHSILHFGGATKAPDREAYFRANTTVTRALLAAAARADWEERLFLLCSSQAALGPSPTLDPLSEEAPPHPLTAYGQSKLAAEQACGEFAGRFPIAILRPPAVYGPRDKDIYIFFKFIQRRLSPRLGSRERYFSLVHAGDVAKITRLILEKGVRGVQLYHVTDGAVHTWTEVANAIAQALDRRALRVTVPLGLAAGIGKALSHWSALGGRVSTLNRDKLQDVMQQYWLMSNRRAETELGFVPDWDLENGIRMTAQWYKDKGWL